MSDVEELMYALHCLSDDLRLGWPDDCWCLEYDRARIVECIKRIRGRA